MAASIVARKVRVFVPASIADAEGPASTRAATWAHFAAQMGTPVVMATRAVKGGHEVDLEELGDAEISSQAKLEKR